MPVALTTRRSDGRAVRSARARTDSATRCGSTCVHVPASTAWRTSSMASRTQSASRLRGRSEVRELTSGSWSISSTCGSARSRSVRDGFAMGAPFSSAGAGAREPNGGAPQSIPGSAPPWANGRRNRGEAPTCGARRDVSRETFVLVLVMQSAGRRSESKDRARRRRTRPSARTGSFDSSLRAPLRMTGERTKPLPFTGGACV